MSNQASRLQRLAVGGLLGAGAVLGAAVVLPNIRKWLAAHAEACPLLAAFTDVDLDRWANEGGGCALAPCLKD